MMPVTRRSVLAAIGVGLSTAGCVTDPDGTDTDESTTDDPRTTGDWIDRLSNEPDPDLPVHLNNDSDRTRTVRMWVVREKTGETVFEETRESPGGTEYELYNLKQADPEGVEAFSVCGELVDSSEGTATTANEATASETTARGTTSGEETTTAEDTTPVEDADARDCVTVETNECYGSAHVTVQEDGSLRIIYSIC